MFPSIKPLQAATPHVTPTHISASIPATAPARTQAPKHPLPAEPNLEFDQKRAKELLKAYRNGDAEAVARLRDKLPGFAPSETDQTSRNRITLAAAQLVIAREHGFASWAKLKQHILWPSFQSAVTLMDLGDVERMRALLHTHPDLVRARVPHPETEPITYFSGALLLHHVAGNPHRGDLPPNMPESAVALLQAGADPNARTLGGSTPIGLVLTSRAASRAGISAALLDVLKAAGAKDNLEDEETLLTALRNSAPETAHSLWQRGQRIGLRAAAGLGQLDLTRELLATPEINSARNQLTRQEELDQALTYAASHGRIEIIDLLLHHGADVNAIPMVYGNPGTALHMTSDPDTARFLVERGANLFITDPTFGGTPADWAEHAGNTEIAGYLRQQMLAGETPVAAPDTGTNTPPLTQPKLSIFEAIAAGDLKATRQILRTEAVAVSQRTEAAERTPLHLAADHGRLEIAQLLLDSGADFYARDAHEQLPLDVAPGIKMTEVHRYLRSINQKRNNFLQICAKGDVEQARESLRADASLIHARDIAEGTTPLIFAACKENPALLDLLLKAGADPNLREWSTSWNPIYFCVDNGHVENLKLLLKAGAEPAVTWPVNYGATKMQMNALHLAAWRGHSQVVRLLLEVGLPMDGRARSYAQFTPLHFAATEGHLEIVRLLVEKGANPLLRDGRRSINAIEMAQAGKHQDVAAYLKAIVQMDKPHRTRP